MCIAYPQKSSVINSNQFLDTEA